MALEFAPLPFLEAIAWARARQVVLPDVYYGELQGLARSMAFSVAGMAKLDQLQQVLDSLNGALERGDSFASWKKIATDPAGLVKLDLPAHRVENIFRTNIQGHYGRGRCEQQKRNVESHPWYLYDAINDSRTRPTHAAMDGMVARHDDTIWARWTPPSGYQSLLPDQPVAGSVEVGLKAWYAGPAVEIFMDSGARVRVTAQHPVLTTTGWVDASDLREGQNLLCYANQVDVIDPTVTANGQKQHPPLVAEQVFRALAPEGVITVPRAAFNLNGDLVFIQGDVDVVTANRSLMDALQAGIREMLDELGFKGSDPRMVILPGHRSGQAHRIALGRIVPRRPGFFGRYVRMFAQKIRSMMKDCGTYGVQFDPVRFQVAGQPFSVHVMGRGDGLEGFASEVTVDDISRYRAAKLRARDTSFLDASEPTGFLSGALAPSFRDVFVGGFGVNAETGRDLLDAHPGLIKADQIVNVRRFEYVGHVYDFQCSNGLIVAQGGDYLTPSPIISNCRCRRIALTEKQAARFLAADTKRLQDPDAARARVEAQPDQGWDYNPCAEPDEGLRRAWAAKVGKVHPLLAEAAGPNLPRYPKTNVIADAPPVPLEIKGKVSAEFQKEVRSTLDRIPAPARSVLNAASSKIVAARTLTGARPDLKGVQPRGWPEGSTWDSADGCASGGVAYVAERYRDFWSKGKLWKNSERTQYVVLHELGHAYDDGSGNVSASLEFLKAYADDVARAEDNNLVINSYFLQHGDAGRRETFAEQFYNVIGGNSDMNMPSTYAYLRAMLGLDTTEVVP